MPLLDATLPASGIAPELPRLLALRFAARQLDIRRRSRALAQLAGRQRSNFRGRGLEFDEVRGYQPGDDIRAIDWRVTARTGSAHTKLFHEERERPVLLLVDQRASMRFGSRCCFKNVLAAELCALLGWSALAASERVGALLVWDEGHRELRPRNSRRSLLSILAALAEPQSAGLTAAPALDFADMLLTARRIARPGSSLFLISDFCDATGDAAREQLFQLARHAEITAVQCGDPLETALPPPGRYAVTNGRTRCELDTAATSLRARFQQARRAEAATLRDMFQRLSIPLLHASTDRSPLLTLQHYFAGERR